MIYAGKRKGNIKINDSVLVKFTKHFKVFFIKTMQFEFWKFDQNWLKLAKFCTHVTTNISV